MRQAAAALWPLLRAGARALWALSLRIARAALWGQVARWWSRQQARWDTPPTTRTGRAARYLGARLPLVIIAVGIAAAARLAGSAPPPNTIDGVAQALGSAMGGTVRPHEFIWEPSGGWLWDALSGRPVLFLGASAPGAPRDVYRARVRLGVEGRPLAVESVRNLTATALGDEAGLVGRADHIAFVARALGQVQGATVVDLRGPDLSGQSRWSRLRTRLDGWLETGSLRGHGRIEVVLRKPVQQAALELRDGQLVMALGEPATPAALDLATVRLELGSLDPGSADAWTVPARPISLVQLARSAVRSWLETDRAEQAAIWLWDLWSDPVAGADGAPIAPLEANAAGDDGGSVPVAPAASGTDGRLPQADGWPPPPLSPPLAPPLDAEGQWRAAQPTDSGAAPDGHSGEAPEPSLVQTLIRPDPSSPLSVVRLVAIDTRQLELHLQAGYDQPRPQTGPRGSGAIARAHREGESAVVAVFSGAAQAPDGPWGLVANRRVLVLPRPDAATVVHDARGRVRLGSWAHGTDVPDRVVGLRQSGAPLVCPSHGLHGPGSSPSSASRCAIAAVSSHDTRPTERAALGLSQQGYLIYGWGPAVTRQGLVAALSMAGAHYVMPLGVGPGHGFATVTTGAEGAAPRLVDPDMALDPAVLLDRSPADFFYLVQADLRPTSPLREQFEPDHAQQPAPAWLPGVYRAEVRELGATVEILAFAPGRLAWDIRPGTKERAAWTAEGGLEPADRDRALVAIDLGLAFRKDNRRGLVLDGVATLPVRPDVGLLAVAAGTAELQIGRSVEPMALSGDATELPLLAEGGALRAEARIMGPFRRRAGACQLLDGTLLVALAEFDNGEATAAALLAAGCDRVVELNRGQQPRAFVHRAGTDSAPVVDYRSTVLYGLARAAGGTARLLEADGRRGPR